jgi:flagellar protein FlaF
LEAYHHIEKVTGSGREIEAAVLTKAAMKLKECQKNWDVHDRNDRLEEALKFNQKVWSIFQSELTATEPVTPGRLYRSTNF